MIVQVPVTSDPVRQSAHSELSTSLVHSWTSQYRDSGSPVPVQLRKDFPLGNPAARGLHGLHPYPGRLLHQIPAIFLGARQFGEGKRRVLDPFCGSGTTLVEATICGHQARGLDVNPLACLLSATKTSLPSEQVLAEELLRIRRGEGRRIINTNAPDVVNLELWFKPEVIVELLWLRDAIEQVETLAERRFLLCLFSRCVNDCSNRDPRISVPVRNKQTSANKHPIEHFSALGQNALDKIKDYRALLPANPDVQVENASLLEAEVDSSTDFILTSPPYLGAQKYIRSSSLSLGWLSLCPSRSLRALEARSIGREHYYHSEFKTVKEPGVPGADELINRTFSVNPLRACIAASYLWEMRKAFQSMLSSLRQGGYLVLVTGDNMLAGNPFRTGQYLTTMLREEFHLRQILQVEDKIVTRALPLKRRNCSPGGIRSELVSVFQKGHG